MNNIIPTIAIIGRPNVGKSTLFNRLIRKKVSIIHDSPGVTRDRIYHICEWLGREFNLIDSGGLTRNLNLDFQAEINKQVYLAINEADLIIFLVSAKDGITKEDQYVAKELRKCKKEIILVVNKSDNLNTVMNSNIFFELGYGKSIPISSIHGIGISTLLDEIIRKIPENKIKIDDNIIRIGIIGKPNVGKSTLVNNILNDQRTIVSEIAGTTRDAIDTKLKFEDNEIILTDTAGLKKNKKNLTDIEWYSELRTQFTIINSDITILLIDKNQSITNIDEKIMGILKEEYKPVIIAVNKLDILDTNKQNDVKKELREKFKFAPWVPIIFISAKNGKNILKLIKKTIELNELRKINIKNSVLNDFLMELQMIKKPPRHNGIDIKLSYMFFLNTKFPHFVIFSNHPKLVHFSYIRFIENQIRNAFELEGIPIKISLKNKRSN